MRRKIIFSVCTILLFVSAIVGYDRYQYFSQLKKLDAKLNLEALVHGSEILSQLWFQGSVSKKHAFYDQDCKKLFPSSEINKCNYSRINCFIESKKARLAIYKGKSILVKKLKGTYVRKKLRSLEKERPFPVAAAIVRLFVESDPEEYLDFTFEENCKKVYLPQRVYSTVVKKEKKYWDNLEDHIFIDKFPVSYRDIFVFNSSYPNEAINVELPKESFKMDLPATNLKIDQMKKYCKLHGEEILGHHVYEAASFFPDLQLKKTEKPLFHFPYPLARKRKMSFLHLAQKLKGSSFIFLEKYCEEVFTKECLKYGNLTRYLSSGVSWVGLYQTLGGHMEVLQDKFSDKYLVKISSQLFNASSKNHKLGRYVEWDGVESQIHRLDWGKDNKEIDQKKISVAFRCMKYEI
jgi:hypothetical protein